MGMATYRVTKNRMLFDSMLITDATYLRRDPTTGAETYEYTVPDQYAERFERTLAVSSKANADKNDYYSIISWERVDEALAVVTEPGAPQQSVSSVTHTVTASVLLPMPPEPVATTMYERGIAFAVANLKRGRIAWWAAGTEFDVIGCGLGMDAKDVARADFSAGVSAVGNLPNAVAQSIREDNFATLDGCWARGAIPADVFPFVRSIGVFTMAIADEAGNSTPDVRCTLIGE